jgi:hypothetical protein
MGKDVERRVFSREDRTRYRDKVRRNLDVFARMLQEATFDTDSPLTGLEIELNLVDAQGDPALRNAHVLSEIADPAFVTELGQFNIEINIPPQLLSDRGLTGFETQVRTSLNAAEERAAGIGTHLVMIGILPTLAQEHLTPESLSENPRYALLNEQIFAARGEDLLIEIDGVERLSMVCDSIAPEAACTSAQFHVQVSPREFASYWNAAQAIAGVQVALGANAPLLFGASCGVRPGYHCSNRPPTRVARSSRCRGCARAFGSASAGSPRFSICSRRTYGTLPRCCPSVRTRTRLKCSDVVRPRGYPS